MYVIIFEDEKAVNFLPLTYTHASFDLRSGMLTLFQRIEKLLGRVDGIIVRSFLADVYRERRRGLVVNEPLDDDAVLFLNSRLLFTSEVLGLVKEKLSSKSYFTLHKGGDPLIVYVPPSKAQKLFEDLLRSDYEAFKRDCRDVEAQSPARDTLVFEYPWELIHENARLIAADYAEYRGREWRGEVDDKAVIYGDKADVYVSKGAVVEAYAVIDSRKGPVYIGENSKISAGAYVEGPAYIGRNSLIMPSALVREGSNVGEMCRVGGELEESIIHGYSNKYHAGFIGHAYIGEWVNLGAMTTNSDLKDTYGPVKVILGGRRVDTGSRKVGCFIGDMVKTSIGTLIYTGKKIGVSSHLHGVVYEDVPSFTIYAKSLGVDPVELYLESAIETQRRMMSRRGKVLSKAEEELIRKLFEMTERERRESGVKKGRFIL